MNNVINFVIHATITGIETSVGKVKSLTASFKGMATITQVATGWMGKLKVAISGLFGFAGTLAQIISGVSAAWQMFRENADKAAEAAKEAAKKTIEAWNDAVKALKDYRDSAKLKDKSNEDIRLLDEKIARHQKLLQVMRDNAAWAAKIREMEARSAMNDRAVEQAKLDGALARGEITERQHTLQVRRLEDAERKERQDGRLTPLKNNFSTAEQESQAAQEELRDARKTYENFMSDVQELLLGGTRVMSEDGKVNAEAFARLPQQVKLIRERAARNIRAVDENPGSSSNKERNRQRQTKMMIDDLVQVQQPLVELAQKMGIDLRMTKAGDLYMGNDPKTTADPTKVLTEIQEQLEKGYSDRRTRLDNATSRRDKAADAHQKARQELEKTQKEVDSENAVVSTKRVQEDITAAWRKDKEAEEKRKESEKKRAEAEKAAARRKVEDKRTKANDDESEHKERATHARETASLHLNRGIDRAKHPDVKAGWEALQRLLQVAQTEPDIMKTLLAFANGGALKMSGAAWTTGRRHDMELVRNIMVKGKKADRNDVEQTIRESGRAADEQREAEKASRRGERAASQISDLEKSDRQERDAAAQQQIDTLNAAEDKALQEKAEIEDSIGRSADASLQLSATLSGMTDQLNGLMNTYSTNAMASISAVEMLTSSLSFLAERETQNSARISIVENQIKNIPMSVS